MNFIKRFFKSIFVNECEDRGPALEGWKLQDTINDCNGDLFTSGNKLLVVSHTNPNYTKTTSETWRENRVEIAKDIPFGGYDWKFKVRFHRLGETSEWVIFSQLWNVDQANFLCLSVKKQDKGMIKIELNKKQLHKTTNLYSVYIKDYELCEVDLIVDSFSIEGTINGVDVGRHIIDIWTKSHHEVKYGLYWSGDIPFNQANRMVVEYEGM